MEKFHEIKAEEIVGNPFAMIGKEWMLVTAQKSDGSVNTMTASWGGVGVIWGKNAAFVVIRPQRYTKEFVDSAERFSLTFFSEEYRKTLSYLGSVSGRDEDKIAKSGLHVLTDGDVPYFEESRLVLLCKKMYGQDIVKEGFISEELPKQIYAAGDYHTLYIAEIEKVLEK